MSDRQCAAVAIVSMNRTRVRIDGSRKQEAGNRKQEGRCGYERRSEIRKETQKDANAESHFDLYCAVLRLTKYQKQNQNQKPTRDSVILKAVSQIVNRESLNVNHEMSSQLFFLTADQARTQLTRDSRSMIKNGGKISGRITNHESDLPKSSVSHESESHE